MQCGECETWWDKLSPTKAKTKGTDQEVKLLKQLNRCLYWSTVLRDKGINTWCCFCKKTRLVVQENGGKHSAHGSNTITVASKEGQSHHISES